VQYTIPVTGERALNGAAIYVCLLGYPRDQEKRAETFEATLAHRIRRQREHNKAAGRAVRGEVPDPRAQRLLARWPVRKMWGSLDALNKQLIDRLRCAELLNYFGRVEFAKPQRVRVAGFPIIRPPSQRLIFTENSARLEDDPASHRFPTTASDLIKIGAQRWNMEPGNVRKNIITPCKTVAHLAIALLEINLARNVSWKARTGDIQPSDDLLTFLLSCPQWVLPTVEDAQIVAQSWGANAAAFPSWQSVDPSKFIELRPAVD